MRVNVIGNIEVVDGDTHIRLSRANELVLGLLVAAGPAGLSADRLADEFWGDELPATWESAVRMAVTRLRKKLGDDTVPKGEYRLGLPTDGVDAWAVLDGNLPDSTRLDPLVDADVLPGLDTTSTLIAEARRRVHEAQERIALSMLDDTPDTATLQRLLRFVCSRDLPDSTAAQILRSAVDGGLLREAGDAFTAIVDRLAELGLSPGPELARVATEVLAGDAAPTAAASISTSPSMPSSTAERLQSNPPEIERQLVGRAADFVAAVDFSAPVRDVVVSGEGGSGKSTILASLAAAAVDAGYVVRHAWARANSDVSYGTVFELFPGLVQWFTRTGRFLESSDRAALAWSEIDRTVAETTADGHVVVIIDDAQWLDSPSRALLPLLATSDRVSLVIGTRSGRQENDLRSLVAGGAPAEFEVPRLSVDEIEHLVASVHGLPSVMQRRLAEPLQQASGGLGVAVTVLLDSYDLASGSFSDSSSATYPKTLDDLVAGSDPTARRVGVGAAVLGSPFSVDRLSQLLDQSDVDVLEALDQLLDAGLVVETADPERFETRHTLVGDALLRSVSTATVQRHHRRAAELVTDRHEIARHLRAAGSLVPLEQRVNDTLTSAGMHSSSGRYEEALDEYRWIAGSDPDAMRAPHDLGYCQSLELTGQAAAARRVRTQAIDAALADGDMDGAAALARSGLPEAEIVDGDPHRVAALERIDATQLTSASAVEHGLTLARQLGFLGRSDDAAAVLDSLGERANRGDELRLAVARRSSAAATSSPWERMSLLPDALIDDLPATRDASQAYLLRSLDSLEAGEIENARSWLVRSTEADDPSTASSQRVWHRRLLDATLVELEGDVPRANGLRIATAETAYRLGITAALESLSAAQFVQDWALGRAAHYVDVFSSGTGSETSPILFDAGHAAALLAAGRRYEALERATSVIDRFDSAPVVQGLAAVAVCSDIIGPDHTATERIDELLAARGPSILVVGAGAFCLGPVARWRASLAEGERRGQLLTEAIHLAETVGATIWQANALRARAIETDSTADAAHADDLRDMALSAAPATEIDDAELLAASD